ncbi:MAG: SemiSWEET transporter [Saprospiraceae bacterium]|nr:SemiSWEET transporter [Saprospiraceae bacterium]
MNLELLGYSAAVITTSSFIPQVYKIYQTKSARDVSLVMFTFFSTGVILWLIYGLILLSWPIIFANTATLIMSLCILFMKIKYDRRGGSKSA